MGELKEIYIKERENKLILRPSNKWFFLFCFSVESHFKRSRKNNLIVIYLDLMLQYSKKKQSP